MTRDGQLTVDFVCLDSTKPEYAIGDIYEFVRQTFGSTKEYRNYLCGAEPFVRKMKKHGFLAGANVRDIYADAFFTLQLSTLPLPSL